MTKKILLPTVVLTVICIVAAAALSVTNLLTADKIAENEKAKRAEAVSAVLPADSYEEFDADGIVAYRALDESGETVGYAFETSAQGYGGAIEIVTGINTEGKITAVQVVSCDDETPGLGQNVKTDSFLSQFKGTSDSVAIGENVDAWTGATISSSAVADAVDKALETFKEAVK